LCAVRAEAILLALADTTPPIEPAIGTPDAPGRVAEQREYAALLGAVVVSAAVQGAVPPSAVQQVVVSVLLGTSLLLAFRVADVRQWLSVGAGVLATAGVTLNVVQAATGHLATGEIRLMNALLVALAPPAIGVGVVRNLRAHRGVRIEAVMGVLAFYILIGMFFAFLYGAVDRLGGHPFFANDTPATIAKCLYYSYTTLATVGYGDLTARTDLGHTLSVSEALLGQIYLVTVVSLIVSNLGRREPQREA
jgi:ion channel